MGLLRGRSAQLVGDPGFGSFFKKAARFALRGAGLGLSGVLPPGVAAAGAKLLLRRGGVRRALQALPATVRGFVAGAPSERDMLGAGETMLGLPSFPSFPTIGGDTLALSGAPPGQVLSRRRPDHIAHRRKASWVVRGGRRLNWSNPRALGRAERRLNSFVHHFTKNARHLGYHVSRGPRGKAHLPRRKGR